VDQAVSFALRPLPSAVAAEAVGLDLGRLDGEALERLVEAWRRYPVLVVRGQDLAPEEQLAFSRSLGELDLAPPFDVENSALDGFPEIAVVSNIKRGGKPIGGLGDGELAWHSDMTFVPSPPVACILHARELPPAGGDTLFLNLRAAWRGLPDQLRPRVASARIFHDRAYTSAGTLRKGAEEGQGTWHKVRITDPVSGEDSLLLGRRRNSRIAGGEGQDDGGLLEALWLHADRPEFIYRHAWRPGDVLLWNNLVTMHRRDAFDAAARRLLHRTQIRRLDSRWEWQGASAA
jgi:taurine dioxygenase